LLVDAAIVVIRGCGLLATLLAPLLVALGALLGILDGNVERRSPAAARGQAMLGRLFADVVLCGDASPFLSGPLEGLIRCLKRSLHYTPRASLLGTPTIGPLGSRLGFLHLLGSP
jgi:hypothetical protein